MGNMIPIEQYLNQYTFSTLEDNRFGEHYLSIIAHVSDVGTLSFDGESIPGSSFTQIGGKRGVLLRGATNLERRA
jgi:hypothetical protein